MTLYPARGRRPRDAASLVFPVGAIRWVEIDGADDTKPPFGFAVPQ